MQRARELVLRLGWGWPLKAPSLGDGSSATENPCSLQSVLVSLVSVSFRQEAVGRGTSDFLAVGAQPGLRAPGMPGGGVWAGVEAAVKGRASEGGLSPIIHLSL